jgi:glycosyltransferase involved in cell wall biosynthesis
MDFSVAITTYNRPDHLDKLVKQVLLCNTAPTTILIIDSSDNANEAISKLNTVKYIRSSHKNQPYQRYLAYLSCQTDVIIFLDDDLEITDFSVFDVMLSRLARHGIRGVSVGFQHHHDISAIVDSQVDNQSLSFRVINFLSGVPVLRPGKIYKAGLAGPRPKEESGVDYFNGAIMGFYKTELSNLYNPVLFSLFERRLGMGEDKIISMEVGLTKKMWFVPDYFFVHPPVASNYFQDIQSFQRKVMYSRLFISLQYGRLKHINAGLIYFHYYYFAIWRLTIASIKSLIKPGKQRTATAKGILQGVLLTFTIPFDADKIAPQIDWQRDAQNDTRNSSTA